MQMNTDAQLEDLPPYWQDKIRRLRVENRKMRLERNQYREQVAQLTGSVRPAHLTPDRTSVQGDTTHDRTTTAGRPGPAQR